ncbi:MAG: hypothetical protein LBL45_02420 [Treponema sp.]|jgi:hypothetical protein|nr:hypothetical protein [Treponema sp.]
MPISTVSDYKIIMERYIDNYKLLSKAGFRLLRNTNKLRYLDEALANHEAAEAYGRIANDTFRAFRDWAQKKAIARKPGPDYRVDARIEGDALFVDGVSILNFPDDLDAARRELVKNDLQKTFSIRKGGNLPFIIETYDTGEQLSLENHLKRIREKR